MIFAIWFLRSGRKVKSYLSVSIQVRREPRYPKGMCATPTVSRIRIPASPQRGLACQMSTWFRWRDRASHPSPNPEVGCCMRIGSRFTKMRRKLNPMVFCSARRVHT